MATHGANLFFNTINKQYDCMRKLLLFLFTGVSSSTFAQKSINGLINAETQFAAYAVEHGTKDAFLTFMDSTAVVFDKGEAFNGIQFWTRREKRAGILNWRPQYAEVAASRDFGYTTGPWTFQPQTKSDSIVARGQYTTVWHLDRKGQWKFLVDLGVSNSPVNASTGTQKIHRSYHTKQDHTTATFLEAEKAFIAAAKGNVQGAYTRFLSTESILNRNGHLPATTKEAQKVAIGSTNNSVQYRVDGYGFAPTGDLAYVYGTISNNDKTDNYLRIWRKEKEGWKIALEVLRF